MSKYFKGPQYSLHDKSNLTKCRGIDQYLEKIILMHHTTVR